MTDLLAPIAGFFALLAIVWIFFEREKHIRHLNRKLDAAEAHTAFLYRELDEVNVLSCQLQNKFFAKSRELSDFKAAVAKHRLSPGKLAQLLQIRHLYEAPAEMPEAARVS